jgi:hypothetical protein
MKSFEKNNMLGAMASLDSILGSYSIPGTDLSPHDPSKKYRARLLNVYVPAICPVFFLSAVA